MKIFKLSILVGLAAMIMGITGNAMAYHDGGVAKCEGCHTMHNSLKGNKVSVTGTALVGNSYLLIGSDASSTCLSCHGKGTTLSGYHVATGADSGYNGTYLPAQRTPGGDFSWLKVAFTGKSTVAGKFTGTFAAPTDETKNRHGHHIVAADYTYAASTDYASNQGPGGTYPVGNLGCNSCHNPHSALRGDGSTNPISVSGSYGDVPATGTATGVYRLLGGNGYKIPGVTVSFTADPPAAVAPATYNQTEATNQVIVSYGKGMSEWCANCHGGLLNNNADATATHRHVASNAALLSTPDPAGNIPMNIYNAYVNTGNKTGNTAATSYLSLVPFERGATAPATLILNASNTAATGAGPDANSNVMCLSCHRAHASGFDSGARFDIANSFVTDPAGNIAFSGSDHEMHPDASGYYAAAYYDRPGTVFGLSQRSLCNKCHAKD